MSRRRRSVSSDLREFQYQPLPLRVEVGVRTRIALAQLEGLRREALREIEDRRRFHADRYRPARDRNTRKARVAALSLLGSQMHFMDPVSRLRDISYGVKSSPYFSKESGRYSSKVILCIRRKTRREVLFAAGKAGGGGIRRSRRRNEFSDVYC